MTGAPSGLLKLAADYLADAPPVDDPDLRGLTLRWLQQRHIPIAKKLTGPMHGLWTDGFLVGSISARTVLSHHGLIVKADDPALQTVTMGADWKHWTPGDWEAARELIDVEGMGTGLKALLEHGGIVLKGIEDHKLDQLARILADGVSHGDAPAKIATALRSLVDDPKWAYRVALTETTRAVSSATLNRYAMNGVSAKEWLSAGDQHVCTNLCEPNEEEGAVALDSAFPSGDDAPPAHPLCRCSLAPAWLNADEAASQGILPLDNLLLPASTVEGVTSTVAGVESTLEAEAGDVAAMAAGPAGGATGEAAAVTIRPELLAARTTSQVGRVFEAEAQRITGRTGTDVFLTGRGAITARFEGSAATAREHAEGLLRGLERFPDALLRKVDAGSGTSMGGNVYAHAEGRGIIRFNYDFTKADARRDYLASAARSAERARYGNDTFEVSFHPAGTGSPTAIAVHEFGHILDVATLAERVGPDVEVLVERLAQVRPGDIPDYATWNEEQLIRREVSTYATTNTKELVAEAFSDVMMNGDAASQLSHEIFDLLKAEYRKGGYTAGTSEALPSLAAPVDPLSKLKVTELRALAKDRGLTGYSKLTKPQLLERLAGEAKPVEQATGKVPVTVHLRAGANLDARSWTAERVEGFAGRDRDALSAVTSYVRQPGFVNTRLRTLVADTDPKAWQTWLHEPSIDEMLGRVPFDEAAEQAARAKADKMIQAIDRVMDESKTTGPVDVYRGASVADIRLPAPGTAAGYTWTDAGYVSTSTERSVASGSFGGGSGRVTLDLRLPEGTPALRIEGLGEGEVLLGRGQTYRVVEDLRTANGSGRVVVDVIPKGAVQTAVKELTPAERKAAERAATRAANRERNQLLESRTKLGDLLAEMDELVTKKAAAEVFEERLSYAATTGTVDDATVAALRKAVATGDPAKVRSAVTRIANKNALKPIGKAGQTVKYDPALHEPLGAVPAEGAQVRIVTRGHTVTVDGQDIQLSKAKTVVVEPKAKPEPKRPAGPESLRAPGRDLAAEVRRGEAWLRQAELRQSFGQPTDEVLNALVRRQAGWSDPGRVVTPAQVDRAIKSGWTEMWRGVEKWPGLTDADADVSARAIAERTRTGEWGMGHGMYGDGVYATVRRTTAEVYRGGDLGMVPFDEAAGARVRFGPPPLYEFLGEVKGAYPGGLIRMALDPSAKIVDYEELKAEHVAFLRSIDFVNMPESAYKRTMYDSSSYAVSQGYDGIRIEGPMHNDGAEYPPGVANESEPAQYIIFNRSVLIFEKASRRYDP